MYEEAAPPGPLAGVARCVWRSASAGPKRIVPDGCLDLVVGDGGVFVAGPDTAAWSSVTRPGAELRGVRFVPGRAPAVLGVSADELRDSRVPLGELWGREGELLAERLLAGELTPAQAVASRLPEVPAPDPAVAALLAGLEAGAPRVSDAAAMLTRLGAGGAGAGRCARAEQIVDATAQLRADPARIAAALARTGADPALIAELRGADPALIAAALARPNPSRPAADVAAERAEDPARPFAVSERRLRRRFVQAVGYGPATYLRVSRFQRAVALASRSPGLAALAAAAGYADQAHLSRDCRALTGLTPRAYFRPPSTVDVTAGDRLRSA
ncbi:helix-turn-helix domain-containing protein [Amycolatopsis sp. OK19-0408]|uniref:Helix-turn-helix domain-containing protein n=1 Tax=Amycolatopsis iheyensis TaxID=2945988 RepID=A0A9X2SPG2_9PSEU|nr:helix-turn-helix domain-containing protein [Amycolatopsis iheyensis]MCR6490057.1 helix-turn-helix domain-containing protein [Amycolatopsis iheyensis]